MSIGEEGAVFGQLPMQHGLLPQPGQSMGALVFPPLATQMYLPQSYQDYEALLLQTKLQQQAQVSLSYHASCISVVVVLSLHASLFILWLSFLRHKHYCCYAAFCRQLIDI